MRRVENWLFAPGDARRVAAMRIGLCGVLAVRLSRGLYVGLAAQPASLYRPRSFMHLFPAMPPPGAVLVIQIVGVTAAVMAAVGWRARLALPGAWLAGLFLNGMATSVGKVVHNDVLLLLAMVPLLGAPVDDAWALTGAGTADDDRLSVRYGWPVRTAMVVV
ncbi:MAG TPA: hypothetical protein VKA30_02935, partial [Actinomycetota bacterium]|nr:hypothetical protein [Actinomycetota bacterium]